MAPHIPLPGPYPTSALHRAKHPAPRATLYLPRPGTPALPLPVWRNAVDGWLVMAEVMWGTMLQDTDQNHFLLELLGDEGKRLLKWDVDTMKTEVSTAKCDTRRLSCNNPAMPTTDQQ